MLENNLEKGNPHKSSSDSSDSDDHFSDAQSGLEPSFSDATISSDQANVERVDESKHDLENEENNTSLPFRITDRTSFVPEREIHAPTNCPSPLYHPVPKTVVEKIDPSIPSHGEVSETLAHANRAADAVPDIIIKAGHQFNSNLVVNPEANTTPGDRPIPITKVERAGSQPRYGEVPGTSAYEMRKKDAVPDVLEEIPNTPEIPTNPRSQTAFYTENQPLETGFEELNIVVDDHVVFKYGSGSESGDDFDDFEEGEEDADFGDFGDTFPEPASQLNPQVNLAKPLFPVLDFTQDFSRNGIQDTLEPYLNTLFPSDTVDVSILPPVSGETPIFLSSRSASLWSQLVASPVLHPPNWIQSRIRRLFLVSLGVPVDLDEILPASKQKKLILPSISLHPTPISPAYHNHTRSASRLRQGDGNDSTTSLESSGKRSGSNSRRSAQLRLAPALDLVSAKQSFMKTEEALNGLTDTELLEHIRKLKKMQLRAQVVLEYWIEKKKEQIGDREAFEGVIENLVKHARNIRK